MLRLPELAAGTPSLAMLKDLPRTLPRLSDPSVSVKVVRHIRAIYFCGKVRIGSPVIIEGRVEGLGVGAAASGKMWYVPWSARVCPEFFIASWYVRLQPALAVPRCNPA
jgi:hypothetical protein